MSTTDSPPGPAPAPDPGLAPDPSFAPDSGLAPGPVSDGDLTASAAALATEIRTHEAVLSALPPRAARSEEQQRLATELHRTCRGLRASFLRSHAARVYDRLTEGRTRRLGLTALAEAAAEAFPHLVPTRAQLDEELRHAQAEKEGREIDQGIFFREILRLPDAGGHLVDVLRDPTPEARALLPEFRASGRAELGKVTVERRGDGGHVTFHNESCLNAEDNELIAQLEVAVDLVLLDDDIRVGVLRGGPMTHPRYQGRRVFSAGVNLAELHHGRISFTGFLLQRELGYISKMYRGLSTEGRPDTFPAHGTEKPWVAAVETFAIGGGTQLLLVMDKVIAAADSYLSLPAAQEGIVPGAANFRLGRLTGDRVARQLVLGGRKIWAGEQDARLLIDEVVDPRTMDRAVDEAVAQLAAPAVVANRRMLHLSEEPVDAFRSYMAEFSLAQAQRLYGEDVLDKVGRFATGSGTVAGTGGPGGPGTGVPAGAETVR
ncbi:(3,5-dihydroxyphenyl)acetyl-CoA 1,2-dioxygenase DpgC [Streptomyces sp. NPDC126933]|uniref:(3,5-dihydroxyphenyl)acetyl-CoA 1,2-dioxygenase DpgC n=1 Tax=unclassified Streptomyces TaxID=2593676 RepID=UPI003648281D